MSFGVLSNQIGKFRIMLECSLKIELRFDNYTLYKLLFMNVRYSKRPRLYVLNGYLKFLRWNFWGKKVHDKGLIIKIILSQFHSSHQPEARLKRHHIISRQFLYSVLHNRGQWLVHWSLIKIVNPNRNQIPIPAYPELKTLNRTKKKLKSLQNEIRDERNSSARMGTYRETDQEWVHKAFFGCVVVKSSGRWEPCCSNIQLKSQLNHFNSPGPELWV